MTTCLLHPSSGDKDFHVGPGDIKVGPHVYTASTLPMEPLSQLRSFICKAQFIGCVSRKALLGFPRYQGKKPSYYVTVNDTEKNKYGSVDRSLGNDDGYVPSLSNPCACVCKIKGLACTWHTTGTQQAAIVQTLSTTVWL